MYDTYNKMLVTGEDLDWGKDKKTIARNHCIKSNKSKRSKFVVTECGLYLNTEYTFLGASPMPYL